MADFDTIDRMRRSVNLGQHPNVTQTYTDLAHWDRSVYADRFPIFYSDRRSEEDSNEILGAYRSNFTGPDAKTNWVLHADLVVPVPIPIPGTDALVGPTGATASTAVRGYFWCVTRGENITVRVRTRIIAIEDSPVGEATVGAWQDVPAYTHTAGGFSTVETQCLLPEGTRGVNSGIEIQVFFAGVGTTDPGYLSHLSLFWPPLTAVKTP